MLTLPEAIIPILQPFSTLFQRRTWVKAQVLLVGAVLAPRKRTVTSALRVMGLSDDDSFAIYHHVLNRAVWSSLRLSRVLLTLLIQHLAQGDGPLVFGIDETIERRRGSRIKAKGIYRDAVRSSDSHLVKASGLRWISLMWLTTIPWAHRTWALPVLTALRSFRTLQSEDGTDSQEDHRLGASDDTPTPTLASEPHHRGGCRQQLRRTRPAPLLPVYVPTRYLHHQVETGRRALRTRSNSTARSDGTSASEGSTTAHAQRTPRPPRYTLEPDIGRMVQQRYPGGGTQLSHRALVSHWQAACVHSMGSRSRPTGAVPVSGAALHRPCGRADPDRRMVRAALAARGDLPRGSRSPRSGDAAPVVRPRHSAYHPIAAGTVLLGYTRR